MKTRPMQSILVALLMLAVLAAPVGCRKKKKDTFAEVERSQPPPPITDLAVGPPVEPTTWEGKWEAAKIASDNKDFESADKYWTMVVAEAEAFPDGDQRLPNVLNEAAYFYYFNGGMDKAEVNFKKLVEVRKKIDGPEGIEVATEILKVANLCGFNGRFEEAEALYKESLAIVEKNAAHEKYKEYKKRGLTDYAATLQKIEERKAEAEKLAAEAAAIQ